MRQNAVSRTLYPRRAKFRPFSTPGALLELEPLASYSLFIYRSRTRSNAEPFRPLNYLLEQIFNNSR